MVVFLKKKLSVGKNPQNYPHGYPKRCEFFGPTVL